MSDLERLREWLSAYPEFSILDHFRVDYTDQIPGNGGVFPSGLVEIGRQEDILGNITVINQYNFGLYYVFCKSPGDDENAAFNADWLMDFQKWVQEQSIRGLAPRFGNAEGREIIRAQNGVLYEQSEEGTAMYMAQLSIQFADFYGA